MPDPEELEALAMEVDLLEQKVRIEAEGNPGVTHAANMVAMAAAGIRKAIRQLDEKAERAERRAANQAAHAAAPKREAYIEELAKNAGRTYDEQLAVVEAARERYRKTDSRPLSEQLAKAPSMNPVKGEPT